jgi:hypothetical protein
MAMKELKLAGSARVAFAGAASASRAIQGCGLELVRRSDGGAEGGRPGGSRTVQSLCEAGLEGISEVRAKSAAEAAKASVRAKAGSLDIIDFCLVYRRSRSPAARPEVEQRGDLPPRGWWAVRERRIFIGMRIRPLPVLAVPTARRAAMVVQGKR